MDISQLPKVSNFFNSLSRFKLNNCTTMVFEKSSIELYYC